MDGLQSLLPKGDLLAPVKEGERGRGREGSAGVMSKEKNRATKRNERKKLAYGTSQDGVAATKDEAKAAFMKGSERHG